MRRSLLIFSLALAACGPEADSEGLENEQVEAPTLLADDPATVVRGRVLFDADGDSFQVADEPYSHTARKWHAYALTAYPGAQISAKLDNLDPAMSGRATLSLYGPARPDGSWPPLRAVKTGSDGKAKIDPIALAMGRYVVLVGPADPSGFLPRYPADIGIFKQGTGAPEYLYLTEKPDGWWAVGEQYRYQILSPQPATSPELDPKPGTVFKTKREDGVAVQLTLSGWSKSTWFVDAKSQDPHGTLGNLDMTTGVLDLDPPGAPENEYRYRVLESIGIGSDALANPLLLQVVPETLGGRLVTTKPATKCDDDAICNEAHYADDGSAVPDQLLDSVLRGMKPTFYDPGESSAYSLEVSCASGCLPKKPAQQAPTKYPVYFAHGFNSSKLVWHPLLHEHLDKVPGFGSYRFAENVDPFHPVPDRAEQLRRNLQAALLALEPVFGAPPGEPMLRINVVAHSMGGLDSRFLIGDARYNEQCASAKCTSATGQEESCCPPDAPDGSPTMWRDRVVSITTLSTPHCGSSFASWGVGLLQSNWLDAAFRLVAKKYFGLDQAGSEKLLGTFAALSKEYCQSTMGPGYPLPDPARDYAWSCATGESGSCSIPAAADEPVWKNGAYRLPPPKSGLPTIFSWAGVTCVTGSCGDIVDPGLLPAFLKVRAQEGDNDGVVAVSSSRFGIFMGTLPYDHFDWNRTQGDSGAESAGNWWFGVKKEPAERFYLQWLSMLRDAGY